ncbi:MAG: NADH-quinone oxidoreductase subunit NuoN [Rhodobacteraceae bacterium CG17_big_fil_post_rev_8_21_14_2_50_65_11]|nr:MAG: NADH-quinone oxidoreductase subunit NuoN [Rhodobacteraceae bacterium CG17_big_fil_post_rev_8_21_14_2_50_65_11]
MFGSDIAILLPEIVLAVFAMLGLLAAVYTSGDGKAPLLVWLSAGLLALIGLYIAFTGVGVEQAFGGMVVNDGFARFAKVVILLAAAAILLVGKDFLKRDGLLRFEYPMLIVLATVGMMVMVSAGDLMTLYMGLELQSLSLYVVASMRRDSVRSTEAGLKYFVLGALSSGLLLYGASLTYGFAGTTSFAGIIEAAEGGASLGLIFGLVFMFAGLAFKVSAVPFHMWTPDVYEGAPTPVTAFFATAPKMAGIGLLARLGHDAFGGVVGDWQQIVALLAVLSMFLGAIAAIGQTDIKRLMAYSSITHMGFALMGLAAGTEQGVSAMLIYMAIYVTMNIGAFAFIMSMEKDGRHVTNTSSLNGFASKEPTKALAIMVLMFSLAGVPPLLGFFGKYAVLFAAVDAGLMLVAILGVIASVIGAFYYLRIVYFMYFGEPREGIDGKMGALSYVGLVAAAAIMVFGVFNLFGVDSLAEAAAATLVR